MKKGKTINSLGCATGVLSTFLCAYTHLAMAQERSSDTSAGSAAEQNLQEVTVTGSRVVRDGSQAPTPTTVIGTQQLQQAPSQNISDFVNRLPAFAGGQSTTSGGNEISTGRQSQNNLNLRGLDVFRTLVLLDGKRLVSSDVNGAVDINDIPQSLVSRIDVVTGGASAAYGSDALAGVVNFVLDKDFTGIKGDVQGGATTHSLDNKNYKVNLTAGTSIAGGRGHLLFSGEYAHNNGVFGAVGSRDWGYDTSHIIANPAYNAATGQTSVPQFLVRSQASTLLETPGGIITGGPLRGTQFNADGSPSAYQYGSLTNSQFNVGGDWRESDVNVYNQSLANRLSRANFFARASYDLTDNISAYVNLIYADATGFARSKLDDSLGNLTIRGDNAFLNPGLVGILPGSLASVVGTSAPLFTMGSFNLDMPFITTNNTRRLFSYAGGLSGKFSALDTDWKWDAFGQVGTVLSAIKGAVLNRAYFADAVDSVRTPGGQIECRVNADAVSTNDVPGCVPWNPFGYGQNGAAAIGFSKGLARLDQRTRQTVGTLGITGDPFSTWAGPVSLASGVEWRKEEVTGKADRFSLLSAYTAGNFKPTIGSYTVTEAYLEALLPLAKDQVWARALDFNAAARATYYSTSGYVTTWKAGITYNPIDAVRLRATRSRDIRAPNLGELYSAGTGGQSPGILDPFHDNAPLPTFLNQTIGNRNLKPEKADTTGVGVVFQPSFAHGFTASVDYFDINVKGAIYTVNAQQTLNRCFEGQQNYCNNITRDASGTITYVTSLPFNLSTLHERGEDIEVGYNKRLDELFSSARGTVDLRALGTHVQFLKIDDGLNPVQDMAGDNADQGPLNWRWMLSVGYNVGPLTATWTTRILSDGHLAPTYLQCSADCPKSNVSAQTIDYNHVGGVVFNDLSVSYDFGSDARRLAGQAYVNIANIMDRSPPQIANAQYWYMPTNPQIYETLGRQIFVGVRFKL